MFKLIIIMLCLIDKYNLKMWIMDGISFSLYELTMKICLLFEGDVRHLPTNNIIK